MERRRENPQPLNLHYLAGFIDGEGCIGITKVKARMAGSDFRYCPHLSITNSNLNILERIQFMYPIGRKISKRKDIEGRKKCYSLRFDGTELKRILTDLIPYLIEKRLQAEMVLEFIKTFKEKHMHRKKNSVEVLEKREYYFQLLKYMKKFPTECNLPIMESQRLRKD